MFAIKKVTDPHRAVEATQMPSVILDERGTGTTVVRKGADAMETPAVLSLEPPTRNGSRRH